MAYYELVNQSSGNRIGEYDTEEDALHDVRAVVDRRGRSALGAVALAHADDQGNIVIIAEDDDLAALAARTTVAA